MPNFNDDYFFNSDAEDGGFFWNGADYKLLINLHEMLKYSDSFTEHLAQLIISEHFSSVYDSIIQTALYHETDTFESIDDSSISILFSMADSFGFKSELSELFVLSFLHDRLDIIDQAIQFASIIETSDEIKSTDISDVYALLNYIDNFGFKELFDSIQFILTMYDKFGMTDSDYDPQTAISDWLIGNNSDFPDTAYDYILPFGLKISAQESNFQIMPPSEIQSVEMPGVDGSLIEDAVYRDRLFTITAYSEDGLTIQECEALKTKITDILASSKYQSKKLTINSTGNSFDVRYEGNLNIANRGSYVKATIPLRASAYGYSAFSHEVHDSGIVVNNGVIPVGVLVEIRGYASYPQFTLGDNSYHYNSIIAEGTSLFIDFGMMSVWIKDQNGKQINALKDFSGKFERIPAHQSYVLQIPDNLKGKLSVKWSDPVLW